MSMDVNADIQKAVQDARGYSDRLPEQCRKCWRGIRIKVSITKDVLMRQLDKIISDDADVTWVGVTFFDKYGVHNYDAETGVD